MPTCYESVLDLVLDRPAIIPRGMPKDAFNLSDVREPADDCLQAVRQARALRRARLFERHGDAKLTDLLLTLADCQKARSANIHDRCKAVYEQLLT